jgi:hypothetical protein
VRRDARCNGTNSQIMHHKSFRSESIKSLLLCHYSLANFSRDLAYRKISSNLRHAIGRFVHDVGNRFSCAPLLNRHHPHVFEFPSDSMTVLSRKNKVPSIKWYSRLREMHCKGPSLRKGRGPLAKEGFVCVRKLVLKNCIYIHTMLFPEQVWRIVGWAPWWVPGSALRLLSRCARCLFPNTITIVSCHGSS